MATEEIGYGAVSSAPEKLDAKWKFITTASSALWFLIICWGCTYAQQWATSWSSGRPGAIAWAMLVAAGLSYVPNRFSWFEPPTPRAAQMGAGIAICYGSFALGLLLYRLDPNSLSLGDQLLRQTSVVVLGVVAVGGFGLFQYAFQKARFGRFFWQK